MTAKCKMCGEILISQNVEREGVPILRDDGTREMLAWSDLSYRMLMHLTKAHPEVYGTILCEMTSLSGYLSGAMFLGTAGFDRQRKAARVELLNTLG